MFLIVLISNFCTEVSKITTTAVMIDNVPITPVPRIHQLGIIIITIIISNFYSAIRS